MILASSGGSSNPFSEFHGAVSGRGETAAVNVKVFFPPALQLKDEGIILKVREGATVEEVIEFALWSYWEEGWLPKLNEGMGETDPKLSAVGWVMLPERAGKIPGFHFEALAIIAATLTQIQHNEQLEGKIQHHPLRIVVVPGMGALPATGLASPSIPGAEASTLFGTTPLLSSSLGLSSDQGPLIFLRIRVAEITDACYVSTTIPVSAGVYLQEVLEVVCWKHKLANPKEYALILNNLIVLICPDCTVASLEGKRELTLVKRSMVPQLGTEPEDY